MICQADLQIYQGDDYTGTVAVLDSAGNPVDLTGYTAQAQIRIMPAQYWPYVAAEITCDIVPPVPPATAPNTVNLYIPAATTVVLYCTYIWDLQLTDPNGVVSTILQGSVYVEQDVTRAPGLQQLESDLAYKIERTVPWGTRLQVLQARIDIGAVTPPPEIAPYNVNILLNKL